MKKRIVSVVLVLCLMVSLSVSAFAAELTPSADKTSVEAGSDVTVTLTLSEDIPNVTTIYYMLRYNGALYDLKSSAVGATAGVVVSDPMTDKTGSFVRISYLDSTSAGGTMKQGTFATLIFTAKTTVAETTDSSFELIFKNGEDKDGNAITHTAGKAASVTVSPAGDEIILYGRIDGSGADSSFANLLGEKGSNGVEYKCRDIEKKTGLDVIKGVLDANSYTYVVEGNAVISVTDPNGVTLANGDAAYGPESAWVATINGETLENTGVNSLADYVVDNESTGWDGDEFVITFVKCPDSTTGDHTFGADGKCTVCGMVKEAGSYTVTMPADKTVSAGDTVTLPVTLGFTTADETAFHAADMTFTYDTAKLEYTGISDTKNYIVDTKTAGKIRVLAYGESKALGEVFSLSFKALDGTGADGTLVSVESAKIDKSANAVSKDAPEAKLLDGDTKITIEAAYKVTLDDIFTGETTVKGGADYTFSATDKDHYDYSNVKATIDGKDVEVVDNGDGTYTVKNVTGNLTVTGTRKAKQYPITVNGNADWAISAVDSVPYGEDYSFSATDLDLDQCVYTLTMTINGKPYTPQFKDTSDQWGGSYRYTIEGEAIVGPIVITFTETAKPPVETTTINFTGSGVNDVQGGNPQTATTGKDFTFTVNEDSNYTYTVKLGDEVLTGTNGSYTIPGAKVVSGTITVTVEKAFGTQGVKVQKYVNLENQSSIWLVTVEADPGAGNVYTYGGAAMYKTTKYGTNGTYAYLVIAPTLSEEEAAAQLAITTGNPAGTVDYSGDVNGSKTVDINDAQLVYDMYNAHYASFSDVTMYKFLCADIADDTPDGATLLNVSDAVAIIAIINK